MPESHPYYSACAVEYDKWLESHNPEVEDFQLEEVLKGIMIEHYCKNRDKRVLL